MTEVTSSNARSWALSPEEASPVRLKTKILSRSNSLRYGSCVGSTSPRWRANATLYLWTSLDGATLGLGVASEIENVSHVFQPSGRFLASNSKYDFKPRYPCLSAIGKM